MRNGSANAPDAGGMAIASFDILSFLMGFLWLMLYGSPARLKTPEQFV